MNANLLHTTRRILAASVLLTLAFGTLAARGQDAPSIDTEGPGVLPSTPSTPVVSGASLPADPANVNPIAPPVSSPGGLDPSALPRPSGDLPGTGLRPTSLPDAPRAAITIGHGGPSNVTHPLFAELPKNADHAGLERTLESEGFDVMTYVWNGGNATMRIAPPSGADLAESEARVRAICDAAMALQGVTLRNEMSGLPPEVQFMAEVATARTWFFKWKHAGEDSEALALTDAKRDELLGILARGAPSMKKIAWVYDPDGPIQISVESAPKDFDALVAVVEANYPGAKIWRPIALGTERHTNGIAAQPTLPSDPTPTAQSTPAMQKSAALAPALIARALLVKSDWSAAKDDSTLHSIYGFKEPARAGEVVFPPGYAQVLSQGAANEILSELREFDLIRSELPMSEPTFLAGATDGVDPIGIVQLTMSEPSAEGSSRSVTWNLLVTSQFAREPQSGENVYVIAVAGWKFENVDDGTNPPRQVDAGERLFGSVQIKPDQSAIIAPAIPGVTGAVIVVQPQTEGSAPQTSGLEQGSLQEVELSSAPGVDLSKLVELSLRQEQVSTPAAAVDKGVSWNVTALRRRVDWSTANDPDAAHAIGTAIHGSSGSTGRIEGELAFPRGYARVFDDATAAEMLDELTTQGLVSAIPTATPPLEAEGGFEALGSFAIIPSDPAANGVSWSILVVGKPFKWSGASGQHVLGVVAIRNPTPVPAADAKSSPGTVAIGRIRMASDEAAVMAPVIPDIDGVLIAVKPRGDEPMSGSLGPREWQSRQVSLSNVTEVYTDAMQVEGRTVQISLGDAEADTRALERLSRRFQEFVAENSEGTLALPPVSNARLDADASDAPPSTPSAEPAPPVESASVPDVDLNASAIIVRLKYASADEALSVVRQVVPNAEIRLVADPRTNTIIVSAAPSTPFNEVQAAIELLKQLDSPEEPPAAVDDGKIREADARVSAEPLRRSLAEIERETQRLGRDARATKEGSAERRTATAKLRESVERAFQIRLDLQRAEARELRERLQAIESNLDRRERVQGAVIDRRVEVLLDPALEWPDGSPAKSAPDLAEVPPRPADLLPGNPAAPPVAAWPAGPSPEDLMRSLSQPRPGAQGEDDFSAATSLAMRIAQLKSQAAASATEGSESDVARALVQRQIDLMRQEFDARETSIRLELEAAEAKMSAAMATLERVKTLNDTGVVSQEEVDQARSESVVARANLQRFKALLEQYGHARTTIESDSEPADGAAAKLRLTGTWRCTGAVVDVHPGGSVTGNRWRFDGDRLTVSRDEAPDTVYRLASQVFDGELGFEAVLEGNAAGEYHYQRWLHCTYSFKDQVLLVLMKTGNTPEEAASAKGSVYFNFERVADDVEAEPSAPSEADVEAQTALLQAMQGAWQRTKRNLGLDSLYSGDLQWRIRDSKLFERRRDSGNPDVEYDLTIDVAASPRTLTLEPVPVEGKRAVRKKWSFQVMDAYTIRLARVHRRDDVPASTVEPGLDIEYIELTKIADDEVVPPPSEPVLPSEEDPDVAEATKQAMRAADLAVELRRVRQQPESVSRDLTLRLFDPFVEKAKAAFDARRNVIARKQQAAKSNLDAVRAKLAQAERLTGQGAATSPVYAQAKAEVVSAEAELARVERAIAACDLSQALMTEAMTTELVPPDFDDSPDGRALQSLQGAWESEEPTDRYSPNFWNGSLGMIWAFAGANEATMTSNSLPDSTFSSVSVDGDATPPTITFTHYSSDDTVDYSETYAFEVEGDVLKLVRLTERTPSVAKVAPSPQVYYREFKRPTASPRFLEDLDGLNLNQEALRAAVVDPPALQTPSNVNESGPMRRSRYAFADSDPPLISIAKSCVFEMEGSVRMMRKLSDEVRSGNFRSSNPSQHVADARRALDRAVEYRARYFAFLKDVDRAAATVKKKREEAGSDEARATLETREQELTAASEFMRRFADEIGLKPAARQGEATIVIPNAQDPWRTPVTVASRSAAIEAIRASLRDAEASLAALSNDDPARTIPEARAKQYRELATSVLGLYRHFVAQFSRENPPQSDGRPGFPPISRGFSQTPASVASAQSLLDLAKLALNRYENPPDGDRTARRSSMLDHIGQSAVPGNYPFDKTAAVLEVEVAGAERELESKKTRLDEYRKLLAEAEAAFPEIVQAADNVDAAPAPLPAPASLPPSTSLPAPAGEAITPLPQQAPPAESNAVSEADREASTLALRTADLELELRRLREQPESLSRDLAIRLFTRHVEAAKQELMARRVTLAKNRDAAFVKVSAAAATLDRAERLSAQGIASPAGLEQARAEIANAQAELNVADRAVASFVSAEAAIASAAAPETNLPDFGSSPSDEALKKLQGVWAETREIDEHSPWYADASSMSLWAFAGSNLIWQHAYNAPRDQLYQATIDADATTAKITVSRPPTGDRPAYVETYAFELDGDVLKIAKSDDPVDRVAPGPKVYYSEYVRLTSKPLAIEAIDGSALNEAAMKAAGIEAGVTDVEFPRGPDGQRVAKRMTIRPAFLADPRLIARAKSLIHDTASNGMLMREIEERTKWEALSSEDLRKVETDLRGALDRSVEARGKYFALLRDVDRALASVRNRIEAAQAGEARSELEARANELAEASEFMKQLATDVGLKPFPVSTDGHSSAWRQADEFDASEESRAAALEDLREGRDGAEARLASLAGDDPARSGAEEETAWYREQGNLALKGYREFVRGFTDNFVPSVQVKVSEAKQRLARAKRELPTEASGAPTGSRRSPFDKTAVELEVELATWEAELERDQTKLEEYRRLLAAAEAAFPQLAETQAAPGQEPAEVSTRE